MKVIITNQTGSFKEEALIDKDSGVIEFTSGDISHVLFEKQKGCTITVVKDAKPTSIEEKVESISAERSTTAKEKKTKTK